MNGKNLIDLKLRALVFVGAFYVLSLFVSIRFVSFYCSPNSFVIELILCKVNFGLKVNYPPKIYRARGSLVHDQTRPQRNDHTAHMIRSQKFMHIIMNQTICTRM